jgi:hypothetical protein
MQFIGLRLDKETDEVIKYELNVHEESISCLYRDRYGVYICTTQGRMFKVEHTLDELKEEVGL